MKRHQKGPEICHFQALWNSRCWSLINQERANANLAPLTFNSDLNEASEDHSTWMLNTDTFSHTGQNGSSAGDRIVDAGYELEGNWTWGENIGWQSERGAPGP